MENHGSRWFFPYSPWYHKHYLEPAAVQAFERWYERRKEQWSAGEAFDAVKDECGCRVVGEFGRSGGLRKYTDNPLKALTTLLSSHDPASRA